MYKKINGERYWREWKEAVKRYGPLGDEYVDNVWSIYTNGVDKPNPKTSIKLWSLVLLIPCLMNLSNLFHNHENKIDIISDNIVRRNILTEAGSKYVEMEDVEVIFDDKDISLFFAIEGWEKDWWEELRVGRLENWENKWLEMKNPPEEQSILQAKFLRLDGFDEPLLEVYGETHMGHGYFYLYKIIGDKAELLLESSVVDFNGDTRWLPENEEKYGYGTCGELYKDGKLSSSYEDMNGDGIADVILSGKQETICEDQIKREDVKWDFEDIKVAENEVRKVFLWDKEKGRLSEETQMALQN